MVYRAEPAIKRWAWLWTPICGLVTVIAALGAAGIRLSEVESKTSQMQGVPVDIARLEAKLDAVNQRLERIEQKLDR